MGQIILITGGSRSGKSAYAQRVAEALPGPRAFVATCPIIDDEMSERVRKHQEARQHSDWVTVEEPVDLCGVVRSARDCQVLLVDCLTLWINNLLHEASKNGNTISEADIAEQCRELLVACKQYPGTILFVTNEIGMGIVPETPLCRLYRDLVGRCNQLIAESSDRVVLLVSGQPLEIKKRIST